LLCCRFVLRHFNSALPTAISAIVVLGLSRLERTMASAAVYVNIPSRRNLQTRGFDGSLYFLMPERKYQIIRAGRCVTNLELSCHATRPPAAV